MFFAGLFFAGFHVPDSQVNDLIHHQIRGSMVQVVFHGIEVVLEFHSVILSVVVVIYFQVQTVMASSSRT